MRPKIVTCPDCGGRGQIFPELEDGKKPQGGEESEVCKTCKGLGKVSRTTKKGKK